MRNTCHVAAARRVRIQYRRRELCRTRMPLQISYCLFFLILLDNPDARSRCQRIGCLLHSARPVFYSPVEYSIAHVKAWHALTTSFHFSLTDTIDQDYTFGQSFLVARPGVWCLAGTRDRSPQRSEEIGIIRTSTPSLFSFSRFFLLLRGDTMVHTITRRLIIHVVQPWL